MIFNKPLRNNWPCCTIQQVIFQLLVSVRMRRESVRRVRMKRGRVKREMRVGLRHSQRDLVAQEVGIMNQVSYSSSLSTFFLNEIKDTNNCSTAYFHFFFKGKKRLLLPYDQCRFLWKFSTPPPPTSLQGKTVTSPQNLHNLHHKDDLYISLSAI